MVSSTQLALYITFAHLAVAEPQKSNSQRPKVQIGYFRVDVNDDRLHDQQWRDDQLILSDALSDLLWDLSDLYNSEPDTYDPTLHRSDVLDQVMSWTNGTWNDTYEISGQIHDQYVGYITGNATQNYPDFMDTDDPKDIVGGYYNAVLDMLNIIYFDYYASWMGVGRTVECSSYVEQILNYKGEWEKAASSAAITLMALIPTFLAFGNLYVPRSSEAFATSVIIGVVSAFYGFGLPTKSISAVKQGNVIDLPAYGTNALRQLEILGRLMHDTEDEEEEHRPTVENLQAWSQRDSDKPIREDFADLLDQVVGKWNKRWHLWHATTILLGSAQLTMFMLAIYPLMSFAGMPRYIFACYNNWTGRYLGYTAFGNAVLRLLMWETGYHERVYVYALSAGAIEELRRVISEGSQPSTWQTTEIQRPPLYKPILSKLVALTQITWYWVAAQFYILVLKDDTYPKDNNKDHNEVLHSHELTKAQDVTCSKYIARIRYICNPKNLPRLLRSGFENRRTHDLRRWRPVIILLHLSTTGRHFIKTMFIGLVQATLYVGLTFFFAAQWGGNLMISLYALILLLVFVTIGRAVSLVYVQYSSIAYGLHVINCDNELQLLGSLRILCSMQEVLVVVNGATYFEGYRLDTGPRAKYNTWLKDYESGVFDNDNEANSQKPRNRRRSSNHHQMSSPQNQTQPTQNQTRLTRNQTPSTQSRSTSTNADPAPVAPLSRTSTASSTVPANNEPTITIHRQQISHNQTTGRQPANPPQLPPLRL